MLVAYFSATGAIQRALPNTIRASWTSTSIKSFRKIPTPVEICTVQRFGSGAGEDPVAQWVYRLNVANGTTKEIG